jgi:hypothetical protein
MSKNKYYLDYEDKDFSHLNAVYHELIEGVSKDPCSNF